MTSDPILVTFDWVPPFAEGYVRDLRVRWLMEELGHPYRVETVPSHPKSAAHLAMQPFGQVPILKHEGQVIFESGAILTHLAQGTALMPNAHQSQILQWMFAAMNSVEPQTQAWQTMQLAKLAPDIFGPTTAADEEAAEKKRMDRRLAALSDALKDREWLVEAFSVADILMAEVLRPIGDDGGLDSHPVLAAYVNRAKGRPAFKKAHADQIAHFAAGAAARSPKLS